MSEALFIPDKWWWRARPAWVGRPLVWGSSDTTTSPSSSSQRPASSCSPPVSYSSVAPGINKYWILTSIHNILIKQIFMQKMPYIGGLKFDVTTPINHFYGRIINLKCYNYIKILNTFFISDNRCSLVSRLLSLHVFLLPITSLICHYHRAKISSRQLFYEYVSLKLWRQNYCSSNAALIKKYCWMVS